ncbi:hypothetical protein ACPA1H_15400 [Ectopseudomonas chengduensis]
MSCQFVSFCSLTLSEQAAWVQAIGSIIAIAVAIWVPLSIDKKNKIAQKLDKEARAKAVAVSLLPSVYKLRDKSSEFIAEYTDQSSVMGEPREPGSFDSDYLSLIPEIIGILKISPDTGAIQNRLTELAFYLFKAEEMLEDISKLQREGYHAAWINNLPLILEQSEKINKTTIKIIETIEAEYSA